MAIQLTPSNELIYEGKKVGSLKSIDGKLKVKLSLCFEGAPIEVVEVLSNFAAGLKALSPPEGPSLLIEMPLVAIKVSQGSPRLLLEHLTKAGGCIWKFNKNDPDPRPCVPHADALDRPWKLNPFTGKVYNKKNNKPIFKINKKHLAQIQDELLSSKDFADVFQEGMNSRNLSCKRKRARKK